MVLLKLVPALLLLLLEVTEAYPTAAGACPAGEAAVKSPHVGAGKNEVTGTVADGGFALWLNGTLLTSDSPPSFRVGEAVSLEITSEQPFKGFLIRVAPPSGESSDLRGSIRNVDSEAQIATATCVDAEGVGGLTHTNRNEKMNITGMLLVEEDVSGLSIDVTIVGQNNATYSSYWYTNFQIDSVVPVGSGESAAAPAPLVPTAQQPSVAPSLFTNASDAASTPGTDETLTEGSEGTDSTAPISTASASAGIMSVILAGLVSFVTLF